MTLKRFSGKRSQFFLVDIVIGLLVFSILAFIFFSTRTDEVRMETVEESLDIIDFFSTTKASDITSLTLYEESDYINMKEILGNLTRDRIISEESTIPDWITAYYFVLAESGDYEENEIIDKLDELMRQIRTFTGDYYGRFAFRVSLANSTHPQGFYNYSTMVGEFFAATEYVTHSFISVTGTMDEIYGPVEVRITARKI